MSGLAGQYNCRVLLDDVVLDTNSSTMPKLMVVSDLHRFLPQLELTLLDQDGGLSHVWPMDQARTIRIEFGYPVPSGDRNLPVAQKVRNGFDFTMYRRMPTHDAQSSGILELSGLLKVKNLFSPDYSRAHLGLMSGSLQQIAAELGISRTEIDPSLAVSKTLLQPLCSNLEFLMWHRDRLLGKAGESRFSCLVKQLSGESVFVFRSYNSFWQQKPAFRFLVGTEPVDDWLPVFTTEVVDNYMLLGAFSGKSQPYTYFDFANGRLVTAEESLQTFPSLTAWHAVHPDDSAAGQVLWQTGSTNEFDGTFVNQARTRYWDKLVNLSKIWITTWGVPNVAPGDIVQVMSSASLVAGRSEFWQYNGYWMVERALHLLSDTYQSKLLLTRNGMDARTNSGFIRAEKVKAGGQTV